MDKREMILGVAKEIFKEKGYEETGLREIAAHADVSVGTVYNYFPNKEALRDAGIEEAKMEIKKVSSLLGLSTGRKVHQRFQVLAEHLLSFREEYHWVVNEDIKREWEEIVRGVIQEGSNRGEISKEIPVEFMAEFFVNGLMAIPVDDSLKSNISKLFAHISFDE